MFSDHFLSQRRSQYRVCVFAHRAAAHRAAVGRQRDSIQNLTSRVWGPSGPPPQKDNRPIIRRLPKKVHPFFTRCQDNKNQISISLRAVMLGTSLGPLGKTVLGRHPKKIIARFAAAPKKVFTLFPREAKIRIQIWNIFYLVVI